MSINNPIAVINALTANIINLENDNFDLKARLKMSRENIADLKPSDKVLVEDYKKLVEQLAQAKEAAHNRPKYDYPVHEHPSFIELQKQNERANERIVELEEQLANERFAGGMIRNYFIKSRQDLILELSMHILNMAITNGRTNAHTAGILALSPIDVAFESGEAKHATSSVIKRLQKIKRNKGDDS